MQQLTQIGLGLGVRGFGPKEKGNLLPGLGHGPVDQQIGKQGLQTWREGGGLISVGKAECAKQMNTQKRLGHGRGPPQTGIGSVGNLAVYLVRLTG